MKNLFRNFIFVFFMMNAYSYATWLEKKAEGWAWYEDPSLLEKEAIENEEVVTTPPVSFSASEEIAKIRKNLEEKLAQAVLVPNEENVSLYIREQKKSIDQAAEFSKIWSKVLLQMPELDETVNGFPISQYGIQIQKQIQKEKFLSLVHELKKNYGLFFFYEGNKKASQAVSLVIKEFSEKHDWKIIAVSKDGSLLEGLADNRKNNGIIENLGISIFPSVFLVNPKTFQIIPIAFGLVSMDQIETNITLQFQNILEENHE